MEGLGTPLLVPGHVSRRATASALAVALPEEIRKRLKILHKINRVIRVDPREAKAAEAAPTSDLSDRHNGLFSKLSRGYDQPLRVGSARGLTDWAR